MSASTTHGMASCCDLSSQRGRSALLKRLASRQRHPRQPPSFQSDAVSGSAAGPANSITATSAAERAREEISVLSVCQLLMCCVEVERIPAFTEELVFNLGNFRVKKTLARLMHVEKGEWWNGNALDVETDFETFNTNLIALLYCPSVPASTVREIVDRHSEKMAAFLPSTDELRLSSSLYAYRKLVRENPSDRGQLPVEQIYGLPRLIGSVLWREHDRPTARGRALLLAAVEIRKELLSAARLHRLFGYRAQLHAIMEAAWEGDWFGHALLDPPIPWRRERMDAKREMYEQTVLRLECRAAYAQTQEAFLSELYERGQKRGLILKPALYDLAENLPAFAKPRRLLFASK